ncbi:hypothetical protein HDU89_002810 [Geranomyces variabilis]|nr:hypothetical protein HDU89_002810 [Geranomyces variabilis]
MSLTAASAHSVESSGSAKNCFQRVQSRARRDFKHGRRTILARYPVQVIEVAGFRRYNKGWESSPGSQVVERLCYQPYLSNDFGSFPSRRVVQHSRKQDRTSQQDTLLDIIHDERLTTKGIASQLFPERKRAATPEADERRNKRPHASKGPTVVNAEEAEDVDTLVMFETEVELPVEEGNSAISSTSNSGSSGHERLLSLAILRERFGDIKQFESTNYGINVSAWIRQAQSSLLSECEKGRKLKWKIGDVADSLLLKNNILFSFLAQTRKPAVAKLWNKATATFAEERVSESIAIYHYDLKYDGIYTMVNIALCRIPRRLDNLWLLPPLIAAMLQGKQDHHD